MDIKENIKVITFKIFISFFTLCTLLWFAVFSYGIMYYLYIPAVAHIKPVHLQYHMSCTKEKQCKFPFDNITVIENGKEFLRGGQGYVIELFLEMPESERNLNQGMFMIKLDMTERNGRVVKSSSRPALLRYRSFLFKIIYTLFFMPGLLAGSFEEKQSLVVPLFEQFVENSRYPTHYAYIEVQAQAAEIYTSTLRIHAQFTGLRYLMYYWPVTSAVIGVGSNFLFLVITMALVWLRETMKFRRDGQQYLRQLQSMLKETRKQPQKRLFQKSVGFRRDKTSDQEIDIPKGIKRERIDIETLPTHTDSSSRSPIQRDDDDEFFDAEPSAIPTSGNVASSQSSTMEQRIEQILGKRK